ncbi:MAG: OmpH family outer membrane protein [candidate division NC10 bacterium]
MKRPWGALVATVCGVLCAVCGPSVEAQELKIGYVNLAKVFDNYEKTKVSDAALEKSGKQKEGELETKMNELKKLRQNLELLNDESREAKQREIEEKSEELQRFRTSTARDLRRDRDKVAKEILAEIQRGVDEYAKANAFSLIIDERFLLYGQSTYDVTDAILKLLNGRAAAAH